ncbi:hypothetical protein TNCT_255541 [Trichonephila clavata]|uniref:Uncharacterized protein n=1 Tax=Trichonephila clavata TaxID=2740835 RepID=A0A8X6KP11_TRICU|nr:hypothetical protein TNCT_255541 [Trichonephila clavata]
MKQPFHIEGYSKRTTRTCGPQTTYTEPDNESHNNTSLLMCGCVSWGSLLDLYILLSRLVRCIRRTSIRAYLRQVSHLSTGGASETTCRCPRTCPSPHVVSTEPDDIMEGEYARACVTIWNEFGPMMK